MPFSISFAPEKGIRKYFFWKKYRLGEITIGDFVEKFESSMVFWSERDYERHWKESLGRIVNGESKSCLITSMYNPAKANFIYWWPMYLENDIVVFHNQILFLNELKQPFNLDDPTIHVQKYEIEAEYGKRISEWRVSISEIKIF